MTELEKHGENRQIAAILLAAGGSCRLGRPKQLLTFNKELLINHMIYGIKKGGLTDIKVILGSHFSEIKNQIKFDDIDIFQNSNWEEGISSSVKIGINSLSSNTEGVIIFVVDQPFLDFQLIRQILEKFKTSTSNIIAASVSGQIIHPVLYRKGVFPKLMELKGDKGGKTIFSGEIVEKVIWDDQRLMMDIDTVADLEIIKKFENQSS